MNILNFVIKLKFLRKLLFNFVLIKIIAADVENSINEIFRSLILLLTDPSCSGHGRDNVIDLCLKNFDNASGCAWTSRFIILGD